jgi:hypothetical protein
MFQQKNLMMMWKRMMTRKTTTAMMMTMTMMMMMLLLTKMQTQLVFSATYPAVKHPCASAAGPLACEAQAATQQSEMSCDCWSERINKRIGNNNKRHLNKSKYKQNDIFLTYILPLLSDLTSELLQMEAAAVHFLLHRHLLH